jgi:adenylylsulfate kinase-like enzyme
MIYWLFGRSGAGKTTLATRLTRYNTNSIGVETIFLDGDEIRKTISSDLGFSSEARQENQRRIAQLAKLLSGQGFDIVVATAAQELKHREVIENILGDSFQWIYIKCSLQTCIERNPYGRYDNNPALVNYEFGAPTARQAAITIDTEAMTIEQSFNTLVNTLHLTNYADI